MYLEHSHRPTALQCATLVDILRWRAVYQSDQRAYIFLSDGEQVEEIFTYGQLDAQARSIAATLQNRVTVGERALLLYSSGLDYIAAFLGCLYAGVVAVPVYPPASPRSMSRIQVVAGNADARLALTSSSVLTKMRAWSRQLPELSQLDWIATDEEGVLLSPERWQQYTPTSEDLTFLQYTSGSTGIPKGVMVSHGNLMHNSEMIRIHCLHTPESIGVSWLPMFHDLGLIAGVLQPLYVGFPAVLMAPTAFIQRPLRWLQALSHYRGTTSYAPNFAYELCLNRITSEERAQLDLRSWNMAVNAAEPVRVETIERFAAAFAACGLKKTALTPAYGLAEATLMVSCSRVEAETKIVHLDRSQLEQGYVHLADLNTPGKTLPFVGCGHIADDQRVVIVNPETLEECRAQEIGEIWVTGPSMARGYWRHLLETEYTFHASLKGTDDPLFVRTGDLGFIADGELFITGRLKDLIILRGRNYYPQDIELTVERSHPSLRPDSGAAFSVDIGNEERLVIVQEVVRHYEEPKAIIKAVRQAITEHYEVRVHTVVLVRYGSILKTSSGKIQRRACREAFLKNELLVIASDSLEEAPPVDVSTDSTAQQVLLHLLEEASYVQRRAMLLTMVTEQVRTLFSIPLEQQIAPEQNLLSLGMDSLTGTQFINRLQNLLGRSLPDVLPFIMSEPTMNRLVDYLATVLFSPVPPIAHEVEARPVEQLDATEEKRCAHKTMQFSLLYFSSNGEEFSENKYKLLVEGAKFADQHAFTAVWMPERHFHPFGGLYPNPSVLASALAMVTHKIRLRAGSVVLPLHHPIRVAEEWSVVDNLSDGRVDLAFAIGWNPNDFVLAPTTYERRKEVLFSGIEVFQKLWRGESLALPNGLGKETTIKIYPLPKQAELTPWLTCAGSPERFSEAGALGANVLTGLLFQSQEELAEKIQAYRAARARHGYDPETGHVTLMLHTFVGEEMEEVRQEVRSPFIEYLRSSVDLWRNGSEKLDALSPQEQEQVLSYAFERYFQTHGLFGTPHTCQKMVNRLSEIGVDEIACLIDFGIEVDTVIDSLYSLNVLQKRCQKNIREKEREV